MQSGQIQTPTRCYEILTSRKQEKRTLSEETLSRYTKTGTVQYASVLVIVIMMMKTTIQNSHQELVFSLEIQNNRRLRSVKYIQILADN